MKLGPDSSRLKRACLLKQAAVSEESPLRLCVYVCAPGLPSQQPLPIHPCNVCICPHSVGVCECMLVHIGVCVGIKHA